MPLFLQWFVKVVWIVLSCSLLMEEQIQVMGHLALVVHQYQVGEVHPFLEALGVLEV